jgi:hypothetical protein
MSGFELDPTGADEIDARAADGGVPFLPAGPSLFSGAPTAMAKGLARGAVAKGALLLGDAATPALKPVARAADKLMGTGLDSWLNDQQRLNRQALEDLKPDPHTTGFAAQVLGGFLDIGASAALFTPEGAAVLEGYSRKQELESQGVSAEVAAAGGAVSGVATFVGIKAPLTLGRAAFGQGGASVLKNMGYGAAINVESGVAERGTLRDLLERTGFNDQAKLYEPFDQQAMLAEATLGALFSGGGAALEFRSTPAGQRAVDAALTSLAGLRRQVRPSLGVPGDARTAAAHARAMDTATSQALANEPVNVGESLADTTFVRPGLDHESQVRELLNLHVADLLPAPAFTPPADAPLGIRANNPGNIRATGEVWQGQTGNDRGFVTFETPQAGIRALTKTLLTYQSRHGLDTVQGIVARWAPPTENDTAAYVRAVAQAVGVEPTGKVNLRDPAMAQRFVAAIVHHENGQQPYPDALIRAGVGDALSGRATAAPAADFGPARAGAASPEIRLSRAEPDNMPAEPATPRSRTQPEGDPAGGEAHVPLDWKQPGGADQTKQATASAPVDAERFPRVADVPPIASGPGLVEPREIAPGKQLYRETSLDGLESLLMDDSRAHVRDMFVTDNRDLAIGQGDNRGVHVVFRDGSLSGGEHRKPGTGDLAGREYRTDMVAPRAIQSFTVPASFKSKSLRGLARRVLADFEPQPQAGGSTLYTRKTAPRPQAAKPTDAPGGRVEPAWSNSDSQAAATETQTVATGKGAPDPTLQAATEAAALRPDMLVALEDGTEVPAGELLARVEAERVQAEQDARAFQAAAHCFLRS